MNLFPQIIWLFILAIPIACIAWTITHEEIFKEFILYCDKKCEKTKNVFKKKFFYVFTCEYCLSHYITIIFLLLTGYKLLLDDWRGYLIAGFSLVWIANFYMGFYSRIRVIIKLEKTDTKLKEKKLNQKEKED